MSISGVRIEQIRELLRNRAYLLSGNAELPVDVAAVVEALGLPPVEVREGAGRKAHGVLSATPAGHRVVVFRKNQSPRRGLSQLERVTVAHEIGHLLVERDLGFRPERTREYWQLEECCDEFARALLLPEAALSQQLQAPVRSAADLLAHVHHLASLADVPSRVACIRLLSSRTGCAMIALRETVERRDSVRAAVRWSVESAPLFSLRSRKHIDQEHPLAVIVAQHAQTGVGQVRLRRMENLDLASLRTGRDAILVGVVDTGSWEAGSLP
jgi:hypothetical protein